MSRLSPEDRAELRRAIEGGCGRYGCRWVKPTGVAPNGGCRCPSPNRLRLVPRLLDALDAAEAERDRLREQLAAAGRALESAGCQWATFGPPCGQCSVCVALARVSGETEGGS